MGFGLRSRFPYASPIASPVGTAFVEILYENLFGGYAAFFDRALSVRVLFVLVRCHISASHPARTSHDLAPTSTPRRGYHTALGSRTSRWGQLGARSRHKNSRPLFLYTYLVRIVVGGQ